MEYNIKKNEYYLVVARFVPENNYETMIREFMKSNSKKDFAIMQSIGMERSQIQKMVVLETVGILVEGFVYGIVISSLMIVVVYKLLGGLVGSVPFLAPYALFACSFLLVIVAVLVIAIYFFKKQDAENILENIRNESV